MGDYTLADVMSAILTGIQDTLYYIADTISTNASVIASVVVLGGLTLGMVRFGGRIFRGFGGLLKGMF